MMRLKPSLLLMCIAAAALLILPLHAQDAGDGRGVVRLGTDATYGITGESAMLDCVQGRCAPVTRLLLPRLFDVDPSTGTLLDASESTRAVIEAVPDDLPAGEVTLRVQDGRLWSDGQPVTAYDVLYSLFVERSSNSFASPPLYGFRLIDERSIVLRFTMTDEEIASLIPNAVVPTPTCDALPRSNFYVLPSHALLPEFHAFVDRYAPQGESPSWGDWINAFREANIPYPLPSTGDLLTSGSYRLSQRNGDQRVQLIPSDGEGAALENTENAGRISNIDAFLAGETDLLLNVPFENRAWFRQLSDENSRNTQVAEVPGSTALVVLLNFADTRRPLPAFHPETGEPLDQGQHRIFSDPAVRRALQLAIDQRAIIDGIFQKSAAPLAGLLPPGSWAFDPSLPLPESNIEQAKRLLDEAGWSYNGVVRRCTGCANAPEGTSLQFTLGNESGDDGIAEALAEGWRRIGVSTVLTGENAAALNGQFFDAYLLEVGAQKFEADDPDRIFMVTPITDFALPSELPFSLPFILNFGSYNNPEVTELVQQARALPGCDHAERAEIYHRMERVLQTDLPFLSVAAPTSFTPLRRTSSALRRARATHCGTSSRGWSRHETDYHPSAHICAAIHVWGHHRSSRTLFIRRPVSGESHPRQPACSHPACRKRRAFRLTLRGRDRAGRQP